MHTYMHTCTCNYMCKWTCTCMYACTIGEGATTSPHGIREPIALVPQTSHRVVKTVSHLIFTPWHQGARALLWQ